MIGIPSAEVAWVTLQDRVRRDDISLSSPTLLRCVVAALLDLNARIGALEEPSVS